MPSPLLSAELFNGHLAAVAISALNELGLLDELDRAGTLHLPTWVEQRQLHAMTVDSLMEVLSLYDIVTRSEDGHARPGKHFADILRTKGYFTWLTSGYGRLFQKLSSTVPLAGRGAGFIDRDGAAIALGGRDYGRQFVDEQFAQVLRTKDFRVVADLGCGSAERLIGMVRHGAAEGIGIDMNAGAIELAGKAVKGADLEQRIGLVLGDLRTLEPSPRFAQVDLLTSFFNGHDLWPREACLAVLQRLRQVFPHVTRFLLCDTYRAEPFTSCAGVPIFTLGFHVTHAVMGQYIPTREEWLSLLEEAGWRCNGVHDIGIPSSAIFDLAPLHPQGRHD
ncbi:class I SAM-dependent methyltransferase [Corallococcus sp. BB11-1]|uniref:class I SAM-dependent methyltransferase n=1 Tax=Corallococcus sp. BB11-1 TaxID=2996783 RepID=UPI002270905C|nr:class I SAM-dependent methyltransferase [Corallococcus sp. BB11-1]MCY1035335.1 class I SAM-dependent methyltransferase [Corallococcus sp. BB11-1]